MAARVNRQGSGACFELEHAPCDSHWPADVGWIETPFRATVCGISQHERFRLETMLDRLSSSHLALRLPYEVRIAQPLFVLVRLVETLQSGAHSGVAVRGMVVCTEQRPGGVWRVVLKFTRWRFLYTRQV